MREAQANAALALAYDAEPLGKGATFQLYKGGAFERLRVVKVG